MSGAHQRTLVSSRLAQMGTRGSVSWSASWASSWTTSVATATSATASSSSITGPFSSLLHLFVLNQILRVLDEWRRNSVSLWPQVRRKHGVGLLQRHVGGSAEVFSRTSLTDTVRVDVINTSELKDLLGNLG